MTDDPCPCQRCKRIRETAEAWRSLVPPPRTATMPRWVLMATPDGRPLLVRYDDRD